MHVLVMRTIASRGLRILGSGTVSTLIFSVPIQQTAFMPTSFFLPALHASLHHAGSTGPAPMRGLPPQLASEAHAIDLHQSEPPPHQSAPSSGEGPAAS